MSTNSDGAAAWHSALELRNHVYTLIVAAIVDPRLADDVKYCATLSDQYDRLTALLKAMHPPCAFSAADGLAPRCDKCLLVHHHRCHN